MGQRYIIMFNLLKTVNNLFIKCFLIANVCLICFHKTKYKQKYKQITSNLTSRSRLRCFCLIFTRAMSKKKEICFLSFYLLCYIVIYIIYHIRLLGYKLRRTRINELCNCTRECLRAIV